MYAYAAQGGTQGHHHHHHFVQPAPPPPPPTYLTSHQMATAGPLTNTMTSLGTNMSSLGQHHHHHHHPSTHLSHLVAPQAVHTATSLHHLEPQLTELVPPPSKRRR
jgi:hypothetical protein